MKNKTQKPNSFVATDFLLSDKPPDRKLLRNFPRYLRWGYYFLLFSFFLSALLVTPNMSQAKLLFGIAVLFLFYFLLRFILKKKKHWLLTENAVWIHGLGALVLLAVFYFLFRMNGYGAEENDPANIWISSLIPLGIVSRYGKTKHWASLLAITIGLILGIQFGVNSIFLHEDAFYKIRMFGVFDIPYPSPLYISILDQVALIFISSVGIHYAVRWRRMSQLKMNIQLDVFADLASNLDINSSYAKTAESIHRLKNMPIDYYPYVYIMRWNEDTGCLKVIGGAGKPEMYWKDVEICSGKGLTGKAFTFQKIVNKGNVKTLSKEEYCCPMGHEDVYSELSVPITFQNQKLGVLDVQSPIENEFGEDDERFLKILADGLGVAMANSMQINNRVSKALQVSNKIMEASEKNKKLNLWFRDIGAIGNEYLGADYIFLFRLSPGTRYPIKPVLAWPKINQRYYNGEWPIPDNSFFWELIDKWMPVYGINVVTDAKPDNWAYQFMKTENISNLAFLPIGEDYPLAALFVCYKEAKVFSDIDILSLSTFANSLERSYKKIEVEPFKTTGKTIHSVLIPETLGVLGELENIENDVEDVTKILSYVENARNRIVSLRKSVVLATVGIGDYEYLPKKQTLRSALVKFGAALNAGQNKRTAFNINGTEEIENEDQRFLEIIFELISESMGNSVVHGNSKRVEVDLVKNDNTVELYITDDGDGFPPQHNRTRPHGIYYWKKHLRREFNVNLKITNQPEGGAIVSAKFPIFPRV